MTKLFKFNDQEIRTIEKDNDIWFIAKDVCNMLDIKQVCRSIENIPDANKSRVSLTHVSGNTSKTTIINEPGLYQLIFKSKKKEAFDFQQWIYSEVLPQLRKTGKYAIEDRIPFKKLTFNIQSEYDLHTKIVNYIRINHPDTLMVSTLGELQDTPDKRLRCYSLGYQKGSPDLLINEITKHHNGLAIEFKSPSGKGELSDTQLYRISQYKSRGYKILISNDYDHILITIYNYLQNKRIKCEHCIKRFKSIDTLISHQKVFHRIFL